MRNGAGLVMRGWRLRLLLDEDTQARRLVGLLRARGHDVLTVGEAKQIGAPDGEVLTLAAGEDRVLLTRNCADYLALHERSTTHRGILCVYQEADPAKTMRYDDIARALEKVESSGVPLVGMFLALNAWGY